MRLNLTRFLFSTSPWSETPSLLWFLIKEHGPIRKSNIDSVMLLFYMAVTLCFFLSQQYIIRAAEPNLCDAKGTLQCENYQTCCLFANGEYGCCPFTAANCCPSTDFCCPAGFRCGNNSCLRMDM